MYTVSQLLHRRPRRLVKLVGSVALVPPGIASLVRPHRPSYL